jgi:hypothetical protein
VEQDEKQRLSAGLKQTFCSHITPKPLQFAMAMKGITFGTSQTKELPGTVIFQLLEHYA